MSVFEDFNNTEEEYCEDCDSFFVPYFTRCLCKTTEILCTKERKNTEVSNKKEYRNTPISDKLFGLILKKLEEINGKRKD